MGHVHKRLCQGCTQSTSKHRVHECLHVLAECLADGDGKHTDALEHWSFVNADSIAPGAKSERSDMN